tara:strand:+ start:1073 stop:2569 length:1497 start_codon:yes stop_codon:yes gene_type:complete
LLNKEDFSSAIKFYPELKEISAEYLKVYPSNIAGVQRINIGHGRISLTLILDDIDKSLSYLNASSNIDVWYLDGFSPQKNPEMWSKEIFKQIYISSHKDSSFSTYTSARSVKDNIAASNLEYGIKEGFASKKHMIKGSIKNSKTKSSTYHKKIAIIGAGIAGCTLAYILANRGHKVDIYDQNNEVCLGASGNELLVTYPRLSAFDSPYARFCIQSFLFASSFYDQLNTEAWKKCGVFLMSHDDPSLKRQNSLLNIRSDNLLFEKLNVDEASRKAGIKLKNGGIFFEKGGFIEPKALCKFLIGHKNIREILSTKVDKIISEESINKIFIGKEIPEYDEICLCTGYTSNELIKLPGLSFKRGQVSYVKSSQDIENLKFPICATGYFSPKIGSYHVVGSSYSDVKKDSILEEEHLSNRKKLEAIHDFEVSIVDGKVGFRAVTKDRIPLVGQRNGIYINTGHGSRGSTSAPLCAEIIADFIDNKPLPVENSVKAALEVDRFN